MNFNSSIGMKNLFRAVMSIIFLAHVSYLLYDIISPEFPEIVNYKKDLNEIEYPITFKICVNELNLSIANEKYQKYGYDDLWQFYYGRSMYDSSIFGWAGHTENGSTIAPTEGDLNI